MPRSNGTLETIVNDDQCVLSHIRTNVREHLHVLPMHMSYSHAYIRISTRTYIKAPTGCTLDLPIVVPVTITILFMDSLSDRWTINGANEVSPFICHLSLFFLKSRKQWVFPRKVPPPNIRHFDLFLYLPIIRIRRERGKFF